MAPKMEYVRLGNSGLKVSRLILGCMSYGDPGWQSWVLGEEAAVEHIKFAYEHGITTFDTANVYSNGFSEVILGRAIKLLNLPREELVIMTKVFFPVAAEYSTPNGSSASSETVNGKGLSRKHIFDSVRASLGRLQMEYVDVLQCHRFDAETPIAETMQAMHDVVQAGYARYIGMSSCFAYQFIQMQNYALTHNLTPFISMQNHYALLYREDERELLPGLQMLGVGSIPWAPLARGLLARPNAASSARGDADPSLRGYKTPANAQIVDRVEELAAQKGAKMAQIALAWALAKPGVAAPIVGTTSLASLAELLGALEVTLSAEEVRYLEEPYAPMR
ncbi:hypothetical protein VTO73DRAFT_2357 [Trametes versicolor]